MIEIVSADSKVQKPRSILIWYNVKTTIVVVLISKSRSGSLNEKRMLM